MKKPKRKRQREEKFSLFTKIQYEIYPNHPKPFDETEVRNYQEARNKN